MSERLKRAINNVIERDKIQLSEIEKKRFKDYTLEDFLFLHEQAERVAELEEENKRYKFALDSIGNFVRSSIYEASQKGESE